MRQEGGDAAGTRRGLDIAASGERPEVVRQPWEGLLERLSEQQLETDICDN